MQKKAQPTIASLAVHEGRPGLTVNKAKSKPSEANPTTANTSLTVHNSAGLEFSTARKVSGIQSADGINIAA